MSAETEAVRLLRNLMDDTLSSWRTSPKGLTQSEQEARQFLLDREPKSEVQA